MAGSFDGQLPTQRRWALGERGEYFSQTHKQWLQCEVIECRDEDGAVKLDVKKSAWLTKNLQEQILRRQQTLDTVDGLPLTQTLAQATRRRALSDLQAAIGNSTLFGHLADEARDRATSVLAGRTTGYEFGRWWVSAVTGLSGQVATQEADDAVLDMKKAATTSQQPSKP